MKPMRKKHTSRPSAPCMALLRPAFDVLAQITHMPITLFCQLSISFCALCK